MTTVTRFWQSAGLATLIEAALVAGVLVVLVQHELPRQQQVFTPLTIEPLVEPPPPVVEPPPPKPQPVVEAKPVETPKPKPVAKSEPVVQQVPVVQEPTEAPTVETFVPPTPAPPPVVAKQVEVEDPALAYNAELTKAVQAAFRVPGTAAASNFKGRARVQFALKDGKVSAITLLESSTLGAVDRAALKAVEVASFPPPPDALKGVLRTYQILVECF